MSLQVLKGKKKKKRESERQTRNVNDGARSARYTLSCLVLHAKEIFSCGDRRIGGSEAILRVSVDVAITKPKVSTMVKAIEVVRARLYTIFSRAVPRFART